MIHASPAIAPDGTLYVVADSVNPGTSGFNGALYAIRDDGDHGTIKWRYRPSYDGGGPGWSLGYTCPCVGDDGTVYLGTFNRRILPPPEVGQEFTGTVWAATDGGDYPVAPWHTTTAYIPPDTYREIGPLEGSPVVDPEGNVYFGSQHYQYQADHQQDLVGIFCKRDPAVGVTETLFQSPTDLNDPPEGDRSYANVDATPCIALDGSGRVLAIFMSEEAGRLHKLDVNGVSLWEDSLTIRRTDKISIAMGRDGCVYVGTRHAPTDPLEHRHGYVYAVWGFNPWYKNGVGSPPTIPPRVSGGTEG